MSRATSHAVEEKKKPRPREPWIIRTYAGFGDARQANRRFLENLSRGQRGLARFEVRDFLPGLVLQAVDFRGAGGRFATAHGFFVVQAQLVDLSA